jgi:uncharacterized membrane protein (Fun14 family)
MECGIWAGVLAFFVDFCVGLVKRRSGVVLLAFIGILATTLTPLASFHVVSFHHLQLKMAF